MGVRVTAPVRIDISGGWPDSDPYRKDLGGLVINAAINLRVSAHLDRDLVISPCDVPPHSGLGASGALRSVELVASNPRLLGDKLALIRKVHAFENKIIENRAGFQDEAAAIFGGVNIWEFGRNDEIRRTGIPKERAQHLEGRLVLAYTGQTHLSANVHDLVFGGGNYKRNIPKIDRMKEIAKEMKSNLTNEDKISDLMNETWELQKSLHHSIETSQMRALQRLLRGNYLATRATGAGGGGCMIFYTNDKKGLTGLLAQSKRRFPEIRIIPFQFDYKGIDCVRF